MADARTERRTKVAAFCVSSMSSFVASCYTWSMFDCSAQVPGVRTQGLRLHGMHLGRFTMVHSSQRMS